MNIPNPTSEEINQFQQALQNQLQALKQGCPIYHTLRFFLNKE
jgi:hypothetical protein